MSLPTVKVNDILVSSAPTSFSMRVISDLSALFTTERIQRSWLSPITLSTPTLRVAGFVGTCAMTVTSLGVPS